MKTIVKFAAIAAVLGLGACSRPAQQGPLVNDPYANGGAGGVGTTALPGTAEHFKATAGDTVLFQLDQSTLTPEARTILANQAGWLNQNRGFSAVIEGHADEQGTREYNLALGARRAAATRDFLASKGVSPKRMKTISYGKERPVAVCDDISCWSQNRRAVTVLNASS